MDVQPITSDTLGPPNHPYGMTENGNLPERYKVAPAEHTDPGRPPHTQ